MSDFASTMQQFVNAVGVMLEGPATTSPRATPIYLAFEGWTDRMLHAACSAAADHEADVVLVLFEPGNAEAGPVRVGVSCVEGDSIRIQFGELWLAAKSNHAVLVPRGVGKRFGHLALEEGRVIHRSGWPAADLTAGTTRAKRRLAKLAAEFMAGAILHEAA